MATLKAFFESDFCTDDTIIKAITNYKYGAPLVRKGRWYEDVIIKLSDREVTYMEWVDGSVEIILAD